jgi:hypothetical protein
MQERFPTCHPGLLGDRRLLLPQLQLLLLVVAQGHH